MFNSIKNSNFLENKENFDFESSIREVPSLIVPLLYEKPPLENLKEVISKLNENLKQENKKNKFKKLKKNDSGTSDVSWKNDLSSSEESEISTDNDDDDDDELVKSISVNKRDSFSFDDGTNKDFFEKSIGTLLMSIGSNLANEQCGISMYREKKKVETSKNSVLNMKSINENIKKAQVENIPFKFKIKCCEFCNFKTESALVMANHYETPHLTHQGFKCNFCKVVSFSEYKIKFHMETVHNIKAHIQKNSTIFQCDFCELDSPLQFMVEEHVVECKKRFNLKRNLVPPADWEPPAKKLKEFSSVIKKEVVTKVEVVMPLNPIKVADIPLPPSALLPPLPPLTKIEVCKVVVPVIKKEVVKVRFKEALNQLFYIFLISRQQKFQKIIQVLVVKSVRNQPIILIIFVGICNICTTVFYTKFN